MMIKLNEDLSELNARFEQETATTIVEWAVKTFGSDLTLLCSGQDAMLVDVALQVDPTIEVAFIDTGFHFPQTINTMMEIADHYRPKLRVIVPWKHLDGVSRERFCCREHKVEQLEVALDGKRAWLSGLRRADSPERADAPIVDVDRRGIIKINPLAAWTDDYVARYKNTRDIIVNPLVAQGYPSVGCAPCTAPVEAGAHARAGRFVGTEHTECGLHL